MAVVIWLFLLSRRLLAPKCNVRTHAASLMLLACVSTACAEQTDEHSPSRWTKFVQGAGQPEPVPAEWVATPAGQLAQSIQVPNPLPKSSGYRKGMTGKEYFDHLCRTEAGEFIYKTVNDVEGFYFVRPPKRPTDNDLKDRYKLEAPELETLSAYAKYSHGKSTTIPESSMATLSLRGRAGSTGATRV